MTVKRMDFAVLGDVDTLVRASMVWTQAPSKALKNNTAQLLLTLRVHITTLADYRRDLFFYFFFFRENRTWHFMGIFSYGMLILVLADYKIVTFVLLFRENRTWYFMWIVSTGDIKSYFVSYASHEMSSYGDASHEMSYFVSYGDNSPNYHCRRCQVLFSL